VKWLPAVQLIDPSSPECDAFYARMTELRLPLLTHAGAEAAMKGEEQGLGNPLLLRRALDAGVRVVVAHGASLGDDLDLDEPEESRSRRPSWELLLRLMEEPRYERQLFADISAITQFNRCGEPLKALLRARHLHHRLVNGSDYPLPAIDPLISTWKLMRDGYLTRRERKLCNAVFESNPLLFDFAVKRCLKLEEGGRTHQFAPNVFETSWLFS
jgi:mannonate dehydratase